MAGRRRIPLSAAAGIAACALLALIGCAEATKPAPVDLAALQIAAPPAPVPPPDAGPTQMAARDCLAEAIYFEARGEPEAGRVAIAHVVLNRAADDDHPDDICAVIREGEERGRGKCQFSWRCDGLADKPREGEAWEQAKVLAEEVLNGQHPDPTGGALFFHQAKVSPDWSAKLNRVAAIGNHVYYGK